MKQSYRFVAEPLDGISVTVTKTEIVVSSSFRLFVKGIFKYRAAFDGTCHHGSETNITGQSSIRLCHPSRRTMALPPPKRRTARSKRRTHRQGTLFIRYHCQPSANDLLRLFHFATSAFATRDKKEKKMTKKDSNNENFSKKINTIK